MADQRLLNATLPIVGQVGASEAIRRAALDVVLAQYAPEAAISSATWADPEHWSLASVADYFQRPGDLPVTAAGRQQIVESFRRMSTTDTSTRCHQLAKRIVTDLPRFPRIPEFLALFPKVPAIRHVWWTRHAFPLHLPSPIRLFLP